MKTFTPKTHKIYAHIDDKNTEKITAEITVNELHKKFSEYGVKAREWKHKCAMLLPEIDRSEVWKKKKFGSIYEYAAKLAGMSRFSVDETLRILRRIEEKPALKQVAEEKGLQRVRPIAAIATKETQEFWAEKARNMGKHTLETYVKNYRLEILPGEGCQSENLCEKRSENISVTMELDTETLKELKNLKGDRSWNEAVKDLIKKSKVTFSNKLTDETLTKNVDVKELEKPNPVQTKSRHIPNKIRQFLVKKTQGKCAYPGCRHDYKILHHTQRFALEKTHDPDKIVPLCTSHERLAHLGLIENEERAPEKWRIRKTADLTQHKQFVDQKVWLYR